MGWIALVLLFGLSLGGLWLFGVRGGLLKAAAAALLLGASGYALQGRPELGAAAAHGGGGRDVMPLTEARHAFFGQFTSAESWLLISEALARDGDSEGAVGILQNAVRRYPGDPQLWVGLGNALVDHGHGLTPPAEFAYRRAAQLIPGHPGPRFFYDLALARSGESEPAFRDLVALMRENPKASWRPMAGTLAMAIALSGGRTPRQGR